MAWAAERAEIKKGYVLWDKSYESMSEIAKAFGINVSCIQERKKENKPMEEIVLELLNKSTITFCGREYAGISALAVAYNQDPALVLDRIAHGFDLERALFQPVRDVKRPDLAITYQGKEYRNKSQLLRELGISQNCIYEMMGNHDVSFETAVDIYRETKERAGIPTGKMFSFLPVCILNGTAYKTVVELTSTIGITSPAFASYKNRHGYTGVIVIIPNTVHDVMLMEKEEDIDYDRMRQIIRQCKCVGMEPVNFLSDEIYLYEKDTHIFSKIDTDSQTQGMDMTM